MKKHLYLLAAFFLLISSATAQLADSKDANAIKGRKLVLVPLEASDVEGQTPEKIAQVRERFLKAAAGAWTFTEDQPEVMDEVQLKQIRKNKDARYVKLQFDHPQDKKINRSKTDVERKRRNDQFYTVYDEFNSSVLKLEFPEKNNVIYRVEMPVMWPEEGHFTTALLEMQDYLTAQLAGNNPRSQMNDIKQGGSTIKAKTLLLNEQDLDPKLNTEAIKKIYPYNFRVVPYTEIEKAVLAKDQGIVYLQLAPTSWFYPEGVTHRIYDAQSGKIVGMTMGSNSRVEPKHFKYYQHYIK